MEDTGKTIPLDRKPLRGHYGRFEDALRGTYDKASSEFIPKEDRTREDIKRHLFDFMDGMRLHVSVHSNTPTGTVIDASGQWWSEEEQPAERVEAINIIIKRMDDLLESLDHVDEAPAPIDYGMDKTDRPHVIYPYPSVAFHE